MAIAQIRKNTVVTDMMKVHPVWQGPNVSDKNLEIVSRVIECVNGFLCPMCVVTGSDNSDIIACQSNCCFAHFETEGRSADLILLDDLVDLLSTDGRRDIRARLIGPHMAIYSTEFGTIELTTST